MPAKLPGFWKIFDFFRKKNSGQGNHLPAGATK
jgi:hypothetical protein